jgi:hypothetical protein
MAGIVDDLRAIVAEGRRIVDTDIGLRPVTVAVRTVTWSGGVVQRGTATNSDLAITPNPRVEGQAGDPAIKISKITPAYSANGGGGYTKAQLAPLDAAGVEWYYVITWADAIERTYQLMRITESGRASRALEYVLELQAFKLSGRRVPY